MPFHLEDLRQDLILALGRHLDPGCLHAELLDEGLRGGLDWLNGELPAVEVDVTAVASRDQDLNAVPDLYQLVAVAYPWDPDRPFGEQLAAYRTVDPLVVRLEGGAVWLDRL